MYVHADQRGKGVGEAARCNALIKTKTRGIGQACDGGGHRSQERRIQYRLHEKLGFFLKHVAGHLNGWHELAGWLDLLFLQLILDERGRT